MNNFLISLNAVLPSFLIMAAGYIARRAGIIREETIPAMNRVAFRVFLPALTFFNVYSGDLTTSFHPGLMVYVVGVILFAFAAAALVVPFLEKDPKKRGVMIQGIFRANFLVVGLPVATTLVPDGDPGIVTVLSVATIPLVNILAVIILEYYRGRGEKVSVPHLLLDCLKTPLVVSCILGMVCLFLKIRLPGPLHTAVRDLSRVASPFTLFLLGAFFHFEKVGENRRPLIAALLGRLVIVPAIALFVGVLLGFRGMHLAAILVCSGTGTAVSSFAMTQSLGGDAALAGNIVVFSSLACTFTLFCWSFLLKTLGLL